MTQTVSVTVSPNPTTTTNTPTITGQCGGHVPLVPGTGCPIECNDEDGDGVDDNVNIICIIMYTKKHSRFNDNKLSN